MKKVRDIDEYISVFPKEIQLRLNEMRATIKKAAPEAVEAISYAMPTFKLGGKNLVHFAGYEHHIGFYPAPVGMEAFKKQLEQFKTGKGSVQFVHDKKLPLKLVEKMTKFRAAQIQSTSKQKIKKK